MTTRTPLRKSCPTAAKGRVCNFGDTCKLSHVYSDLTNFRSYLIKHDSTLSECPPVPDIYKNSKHTGTENEQETQDSNVARTGANAIPIGQPQTNPHRAGRGGFTMTTQERVYGHVPTSVKIQTGIHKATKIRPLSFSDASVYDGEQVTPMERTTEAELYAPRVVLDKLLTIRDDKPPGSLVLTSYETARIFQDIALRITSASDAARLFELVKDLPIRVNLEEKKKDDEKKNELTEFKKEVIGVMEIFSNKLEAIATGPAPGNKGGFVHYRNPGTSAAADSLFLNSAMPKAAAMKGSGKRSISPGIPGPKAKQRQKAAAEKNAKSMIVDLDAHLTRTMRNIDNAPNRVQGYVDSRKTDAESFEEKYGGALNIAVATMRGISSHPAGASTRKLQIATTLMEKIKKHTLSITDLVSDTKDIVEDVCKSFVVTAAMTGAAKSLRVKSIKESDFIIIVAIAESILTIATALGDEGALNSQSAAGGGIGDDDDSQCYAQQYDDMNDEEMHTANNPPHGYDGYDDDDTSDLENTYFEQQMAEAKQNSLADPYHQQNHHQMQCSGPGSSSSSSTRSANAFGFSTGGGVTT
eukprot:g19948.t1